jgi:hypothetical protein
VASEIDDHINSLYREAEKFNEELGIFNLKILDKLHEIESEEFAAMNAEDAREEDFVADYQHEEGLFRTDDLNTRIDSLFAL